MCDLNLLISMWRKQEVKFNQGTVLNLLLCEGGLPQVCLVRGLRRAGSGSDGAVLEKLMRMLLFFSLMLRKADGLAMAGFDLGLVSDTSIFHN